MRKTRNGAAAGQAVYSPRVILSTPMRRGTLTALVASALLWTVPAAAHGLLMKLRSEGGHVVGQLYYSNGHQAAGEWITLTDSEDAGAEQNFQTDAQGHFRQPVQTGHRYTVKATGEEGHSITMTITPGESARGTMLDDDPLQGDEKVPDGQVAGKRAARGWADIPAYALIGGGLLLSVFPALWLRRRDRLKGKASA